MQLAKWISGKKCSRQRNSEYKGPSRAPGTRKAVKRPMRLRQSEQEEQLEETYQKGRKVRRCQGRLPGWEKTM